MKDVFSFILKSWHHNIFGEKQFMTRGHRDTQVFNLGYKLELPKEHFYFLVETPHYQGCDPDFTSDSILMKQHQYMLMNFLS